MLNNQLIINARVSGYNDLQQISINNDNKISKITSTKQNIKDSDRVIDVAGDWLSLGGVDLQINGGLGLAFPDLEAKDLHKLEQICDFLWQEGIDGFLPTIVTTAVEKIQRSLETIEQFIQSQKNKQNTAKILGVHLEGPFLNYEKRGAHPAEYLLPLTIENVKEVLGHYSHLVKIITLAPELDNNLTAIKYLLEQNIIVSLGHSLATAEQAQAVFKLGASMVTHAFNAMPPLHHRQPGLLGEAITNPNVFCGVIADGNHVCPTMVQILLRASNYQQGIFLVSDALAPIGLPDGVYPWDTREITVNNGTAKLNNGTLAGTTLPLLKGVQNLVRWGICDVGEAIAMATESPRNAIALPGLSVGQSAQLLRWHYDSQNQSLSWHRLQ
ncbi:MAG: N-acetylglucosamine-6-phosphate deacetylase [Pleurocapsa sp.]